MSVASEATRRKGRETRVVAVTGASGFVGTWLMRHLAAITDAEHIRAVPLFAAGGDIRDARSVEAAVKELQPAAVIHLAAVAAPADARQDPRNAWEVNVLGTLNVALALCGYAPQARLVFAGSSEVYGASFEQADRLPLGEDAPLQPLTSYAATKAAADLMMGQMARDGLDCVRFRAFNHTGPGQAEKYAVSAFARQIARIEKGLQPPVLEVGNLAVERDFLDVRDVVGAYATAALTEAPLEPGIAMNLASGKARPLREIVERLIALSGRAIEVEVNPTFLREGDLPHVCGNASLADRAIGWKPTIPLDRTLETVLNDWRARV